jgi:hypothetical protein
MDPFDQLEQHNQAPNPEMKKIRKEMKEVMRRRTLLRKQSQELILLCHYNLISEKGKHLKELKSEVRKVQFLKFKRTARLSYE